MNVVITGSTRGIGRGLAAELSARGANVVVSGRQQADVDAVVAELGSGTSGSVTGQACDIRNEDQLQALWDHAVEAFGTVDVWVNNAGVSVTRRPLWDLTGDDIDSVVDTNLKGTITGTRVALRGMRSQGSGTVYLMEGFGSGNEKAPGMAAYGATKRAVRYLVAGIARDLDDDGSNVRVGAISPGIVVTDLLMVDHDDDPEAFEKAKKVFNILGDTVETVTPFLAERILAGDTNIRWLTRPKALGRFATAGFRKRDLFADV